MGKLRILASGRTPSAQAQQRGKLFEQLMADVLRQLGFSIDRVTSVNYSGMEIDIQGRAVATQIPVYAECKFYETEVDSPKLRAFVGKFTMLWRRDSRCQGLFLAVPGVNSHAKAFYRDNLENAVDMTVRLVEEEQILASIFQSRVVCPQDVPRLQIPPEAGKPGDWLLLYTDRGYFFCIFVVPHGSAIPKSIGVFDGTGRIITDEETLDYLRGLDAELLALDVFKASPTSDHERAVNPPDPEEIVEVRGSSSCFEYQFPASPEFFVGRTEVLAQVDVLVDSIISRAISARGLLFEGNSGLGKSSVVLSAVSRLNATGHFAVSIDCRSASSPQFVLRAVNHVLTRYDELGTLPGRGSGSEVSGLESAARLLIDLGRRLQDHGRIIAVFFDQFENLFFLPESLRPIRDLFLKVCDAQTNVLLGFSWKTISLA